MVAIDLLYFAWVREGIGLGHETVEPPGQVASVSDLIDWLATRGEGYAAVLGDKQKLRAAVDQMFVALDAPIGGAREVALFPPVTGG